MTNNPTIDGVSRVIPDELLNAAIETISEAFVGTSVERDLRALLDAPAVERQDEVAFLEMELEGERRAKLELADVLGVGDEPRWKWMLSAARALQSTITQLRQHKNDYMEAAEETRKALTADIASLEARITQLESEKEFAAATYQAARDRIAELESGRGEAPFYISVDDWNMLVRDDVEIASVRVSRTRRSKFTEPLFAAPPAPVATLWEICMPDEPGNPESPCEYVYVNSVAGRDLLLLRDGSSVYAEYACLDATAALNGPAK